MRKLYLHVGLSKTGTSALQSWLSLNVGLFKKQGFDYADLSPMAKKGSITAGNGVPLFLALTNEDYNDVEDLILNTYFQSNKKAIISSEVLQSLSQRALVKLKDICCKNKISITVIAYARSVYELLYSNYLQGIKRHGFSFKFGDKGNLSYAVQTGFLRNYWAVFNDALITKNYDIERGDIFHSFSNLIGFDNKRAIVKNKIVNRSLTANEAEVLRKVNAIHKGVFSTEISDYLISMSPNKLTSVNYDEHLRSTIIENCKNDLTWINTNLLKEHEALLPSIGRNSNNIENDSLDDIYQVVIDWCLKSKKTNKDEGFVELLRDLAVSFETYKLASSYKLMCKALKLRPTGPFIAKRVEIYKKQLKLS